MLVAALSYKLQYTKSFIEINRFAIKQGFLVMGAVSKLINHIAKYNPSIPTILSFVDCRYHTGVSLEAAGFLKLDIPHGWMWADGERTYNRLACRANMDERRLTEKEHAEERGWCRIYDAGQAKFIKENPYYRPEIKEMISTIEEKESDEKEPNQKYSVYHSNLRSTAYNNLKSLAEKSGYVLISSLDDYTKGNCATREIYWKCKNNHTSHIKVKRFKKFKCKECDL